MAEFPAMPLWTDAYLADTSHLSTEEHGAYFLLLMAAWRTKDAKLRDDDDFLARVSRSTARVWRRLRPVMLQFWTVEAGYWFQKRLQKERLSVARVSQKRAKAAHAMHLKNKETRDAHKYAKRMHPRGGAHARGVDSNTLVKDSTVPTDSTIQKEKKENSRTPSLSLEPEPPAAEMPEAKPPRAVRGAPKEYSAEFLRVWSAYPVRPEDTKVACYKHWLRVKAEAEVEAIVAAAKLWRTVQGPNAYRFGLLRWLRDRAYMHDPPVYQANGYGNGSGHDAFTKVAADMLRGNDEPTDSEADYGEYLELEGTCDRMPD